MILLAAIGVGGFWVYINYFTQSKEQTSLTLIPDDAVFVVETNNLSEAWTAINSSNVWQYLKGNEYFKEIDSDINTLNKYLAQNKVIGLLLKDRNLTVSVHMISAKEWDMLFVVDLKKTSNMLKVNNIKDALTLVEGYNVSQRKYNGHDIIELADNKNPNDIIYIVTVDNLILAGFSGALVEKSIDQKDDMHWQNNDKLKLVSNKLAGKKLFRMFVNYSQVNKFSMSYITEESESLRMLSNSLGYSVFDINLEEEMLSFKGYTDIDSISSYIRALAKVAPGKYEAWEVLSNQTSLYFSMSFDNYSDFYQNLINQYKEGNADDMEDIEKNIKMIENYLNISMQQDFFSWIDSEIAFVKLRPEENTRVEDVLVVIKAKDISQAKVGMATILKKIKGRTPVKFTSENYKNYEIFQLESKGFFKPFFGKMLKNMEKPFFTYINNFVVFSNSIETLKSNIDDFIAGATLSNDENFVDFKDEFRPKSNLSVFIRTPKMYENLYYYSTPEDRKAMKENREFILSFSQIGFQLNSEGEMYETLFKAKHNPNALNADKLETFEKETSDAMFRNEIDSLVFKYTFAENTFVKDTLYTERHTFNNKLKIEGKIKNNAPDGLWKTYYESGNIQNSVNYSSGQINGEAFFFYDNNPRITKAEVNFENDKVIDIYYEYYENGAQKAKIEYKNGRAHGNASFFYPNGKLKIKAEFEDGMKDGKWEYFDEKGTSMGKEKWKKGMKKK